jgi:hypothetical protein
MPRKLPWASVPAATKSEQQRLKTPEPPAELALEGSSDRGRSANPPVKRRPRSRSHSTSPPPGPPSIKPMREGFDQDDIWMIVEDEFEAIAKTFTAHLHHAEYKKLVKKAREAPPKSLPTPSSPMSKETRRRLQRNTLHLQQQQSLDEIGAGPSTRNTEDNVEDPWRGTSIAGLIASGSQEKRSLKGIDRLPSSTRAAQGFARPWSRDGVRNDIKSVPQPKRPRLDKEPAVNPEISTHSPVLEHGVEERRVPSKSDGRRDEVQSLNGGKRSADANRTQSKAATPRRSISSLLAKRKKVKQEDSKEERLSQVPMFLI